MISIDLEESDVLIRRVSNGWVVKYISENDPNYLMTYVFSDEPHNNYTVSAATSLLDTLFHSFECYFQSKREGGIKMELKEKGWTQEEELEEE